MTERGNGAVMARQYNRGSGKWCGARANRMCIVRAYTRGWRKQRREHVNRPVFSLRGCGDKLTTFWPPPFAQTRVNFLRKLMKCWTTSPENSVSRVRYACKVCFHFEHIARKIYRKNIFPRFFLKRMTFALCIGLNKKCSWKVSMRQFF